jgi:CrcB protein
MCHDPATMKSLFVFAGAGTGGLLRYWLGGLVQAWWGPAFPLGTLVVNVSGCLVMGLLASAWSGPVAIREEYRLAVLVGVLGGFTTFSSFGRETLLLVQDALWLRASVNVALNVALSLVGIWLGSAAATRFYGTGAT